MGTQPCAAVAPFENASLEKRAADRLSATLYFIHFQRSDRQALAALSTAASQHFAAILGAHALQETMHAAALTLLGLESTLHFSFLLLKSRYGLFAQGFAHTLGQPCRVRLYAISTPFVKRFFAEFFVCASNNLSLQTVIHYILYYSLLKNTLSVENFPEYPFCGKIFNISTP